MSLRTCLILVLFFMLHLIATQVFAEESSQPYIDQLKKELREKEPTEAPEAGEEIDPYIQSLKKKMESGKTPSGPEQSYTEQLKATDPLLEESRSEESYTEIEKGKIEPKPEGGAIEAVLEGHSELQPKREGKIHHAFGVRYGASLTRTFSAPAGVQQRAFNDIYGSSYAPDISFFYEFQPFHSKWLGNIGLMFMGGLGYFQGTGKFAFNVSKPDGSSFPSDSTTKFQFFTLPVTVAANYRINLFHFLRPYVMLGPTEIGYVEMRNDGVKGNRGHSEGLFMAGGVAVLMDWIYPGGAWDLYSTYGIQHYYLTVEYSRLTTFTGDANLSVSGITAGITFEY